MQAALCLSTSLHLAAIMYEAPPVYNMIIYMSVKLSFIYHALGERVKLVNKLDFMMAGIWFLADLYFSYYKKIFMAVLMANLASGAVYNICGMRGGHVVWHVINAFKAWQVARWLTHGVVGVVGV